MNDLMQTKYVLYPWFKESGSDLVHSNDISRFESLIPYGKIFELHRGMDGYVIIKYGPEHFRVKPDLIKEVPPIKGRIGDKIEFQGKTGEIIDIYWHFQNCVPYFYVKIDGKKLSRRFSENEFSVLS